ncbi:MAG: carboxylate-amine ligase [Deltaproteobacteria bacterium]|nr:MAG: carboxylate-amine ligase [Deltaproteobacteria bacterium]
MATEFTLGIEEEYQIIDPVTRELRSGIDDLMGERNDDDEVTLQVELHKSVVEVATGICADIQQARQEVLANRRRAARIAERVGLRIAAAATHPIARWQDQDLSIGPTYDRLVNDLQDVARANLIFGLHVHVGIPDRDEAIAIFNSARYFLPHVLALSTSSPFFEGRRSGLKSMRSLIFERLPRTGIPERFSSYREFETFVALLVKTGCIDSGKRIWWDLRPHPSFSTLEFRVCDLPTRADDVIAIAALLQALVARLARVHRGNMAWNDHRSALLRENKWRALRYGLEGHLIDFGRQSEVPFADLVEELLELVDDVVDELGTRAEMDHIRRIVAEGTSADHQLRIFEESGGNLEAVVDWLIEETMVGVPRLEALNGGRHPDAAPGTEASS